MKVEKGQKERKVSCAFSPFIPCFSPLPMNPNGISPGLA